MIEITKNCSNCGREILVNYKNENVDLCLQCHILLNKYCKFCGEYDNVTYCEHTQSLVCEDCRREINNYKQPQDILDEIIREVENGQYNKTNV